MLGRGVFVLDAQDHGGFGEVESLAHFCLAFHARAWVRVQPEVRGLIRQQSQPPVGHDLGHELGEQVEEAIECATGRESTHLGRKHGFKEGGIQIGRDAIANGGLVILQLREESVLLGLRWNDGMAEGSHEFPGATFDDVGGSARPLGPEPVSRTVGTTQDHGHTLGGRLGPQEPCKLHARDAGHPQIRDYGGRGGAQGRIGPLDRPYASRGLVPLHTQTLDENLAGLLIWIDEDDRVPTAHGSPADWPSPSRSVQRTRRRLRGSRRRCPRTAIEVSPLSLRHIREMLNTTD